MRLYAAVVQVHNPARYREAESGAAGRTRAVFVGTLETFEETFGFAGRTTRMRLDTG